MLRQRRFCKNQAFVALISCFISKGYDSFKKMDNFFTLPLNYKKPVSTLGTFALPKSSARPNAFIAAYLILKYSKNDLQQILKTYIEAWTSAIVAPLPEGP